MEYTFSFPVNNIVTETFENLCNLKFFEIKSVLGSDKIIFSQNNTIIPSYFSVNECDMNQQIDIILDKSEKEVDVGTVESYRDAQTITFKKA